MEKKYDLEERLIKFAARIIIFTNSLPSDFAGNHLRGQLIRSSCSPALNYGEAQGAESQKDFLHKMGICIKELKESKNCLRILEEIKYGDQVQLIGLLKEAIELKSICGAIINKTREKNKVRNQGTSKP
jgi:four helix bundle protein